jgi:tripartite-type tricarboxylate transporter receptor subunit TctC
VGLSAKAPSFSGPSFAGLLAAGALAAGILASPAVFAQAAAEFPSRPVIVTTPFAVGSGPDVVLRVVADKLGKAWNQRLIVENKPGGGGFIAIDSVRRAAADGYSLLQLDSEHLAALPHLYKQRKFDTLKTFEPAASLFRTPFLIAVPTDSKWKSVADLVAAAKAESGQLPYGSWGVGSPGHLGGELLEDKAGITMQHIPYREVSQLYMNVGTGDVSWSFASIPSSQATFKSGKIRYLAVATPKRIPQMPDVPTVEEAGGPAGIDVNSFVVLVAPKGVPPAVREKIGSDVAKVLADPEIKARFDAFAFEVIDWKPDAILRQAEEKSAVYKTLIEGANISLD